MTTATEPKPRTGRGRRPRAVALVALLCATGALPGCGLSVIGHRVDPFGRGAKAPSMSNLAESIRDTREQASLAPHEPYWSYRLGEIYVTADSLELGEAALRGALSVDPTYAPALSMLSKLYFTTGRNQQAVDMLEAARARTETTPKGFPPALRVGLALHYDALGRADLSRGVLAGLTSRERDGSPSVYLILRGASPDSATALANQALHDAPKSAVSQNNFGITRLRAGDPAGARRAFLTAIEIDPRLAGPYYNLAILDKFYALDDEQATRWFNLYRERSTDDPDNLAQVFAPTAPAVAGKGE
jgi:tetratricopeptide (TPR) repeat protein